MSRKENAGQGFISSPKDQGNKTIIIYQDENRQKQKRAYLKIARARIIKNKKKEIQKGIYNCFLRVKNQKPIKPKKKVL